MVEAVQAVGNFVGGVAGYESGKFNKKANYAAATQTEQDGEDTAQRIRDNARQIIGEQLAAQGSSGFQIGTGSALDAIAQSQMNAALDVLNVRRKAAANARSLRIKGDIAKSEGENALMQGVFGAAAHGVSAYNDWAGARSTYGPSSAPAAGGGGSGYMPVTRAGTGD